MEIIRELKEIKHICLGLGFFDGVHLGHKRLMSELVSEAKSVSAQTAVITFKKSPAENFIDDVSYINSLEEKENYIAQQGIDYLIELDFDHNLMSMTAEDYIEKVLYRYFEPKCIVSGFNHTFGHGKSGNPDLLRKYQTKFNYKYVEIPPLKYEEEIVSSTLIKELLEAGKVEEANQFLGYKYSISGEVIYGNQIGRTIGFPTANLIYPEKKVKIPFGVYSAGVNVQNDDYTGLLNYGVKPTVAGGERKPLAEVHIIGFNKDIYGEEIRISINKKIRDEQKFSSLNELKNQINKDMMRC